MFIELAEQVELEAKVLLTLSLTLSKMPSWPVTSASFSKKLAKKFHQNSGIAKTQQKDDKEEENRDGVKDQGINKPKWVPIGVVVQPNHSLSDTITQEAIPEATVEEVNSHKTRETRSNLTNSVIIAEL